MGGYIGRDSNKHLDTGAGWGQKGGIDVFGVLEYLFFCSFIKVKADKSGVFNTGLVVTCGEDP